jgi:hypothetical protein
MSESDMAASGERSAKGGAWDGIPANMGRSR